ncbi:MAG: hypothetical protein PHE79_04785 [Eubacteriales bacterium]|nr:hypothetical protein [Eubacteriales bacterium]
MMGKDEIKRILNELIDSADEITDFSISNDVEEKDLSTLDGVHIERKPTGIANIYVTIYKEPK